MFEPGRCARYSPSLRIPAWGWKKSFHMIATITEGIAHGTRASERASHRPWSGWLRRRARPSARTNWMDVTANAQIRPILKELTKSVSCRSRRKLCSPTKWVGTPKPACESVNPR